jgi:hypothetical protein
MHENREIPCTSWSSDQDRSAKAINRTAEMNVQEKSDCAVIPVNQPNNEGQQPSAEVGEGRAQTEENIVQSHMRPTRAGSACPRDRTVCGRQHVSPPFTPYGQKTHPGRCPEQEFIALRAVMINQAGRSLAMVDSYILNICAD